ncbi:hypothetical protein ACFL6B_06095 [Thermodesulfobacteriota bacterium]
MINYYVRAKLPELLTIHSGCATINNKRFILVGDKGVGKTTLLCKLLFSGEMVHSDEYVILDDSQIIPFPRKFLIKEGTLKFIPELFNICKNLRSYPSSFNGFYFFFDPTDGGYNWEITSKRMDAIFHLEPNHGEETRVESIPKWQMVEKVMLQIDNFSSEPGLQIKNLSRVVNECECFNLYLGDLDQAVKIIKEKLL